MFFCKLSKQVSVVHSSGLVFVSRSEESGRYRMRIRGAAGGYAIDGLFSKGSGLCIIVIISSTRGTRK